MRFAVTLPLLSWSIGAALDVEADALEIVLHREVDDAGNGVGTVGGRRAAGQHFDAVHERDRDRVQVGARLRRRRRR